MTAIVEQQKHSCRLRQFLFVAAWLQGEAQLPKRAGALVNFFRKLHDFDDSWNKCTLLRPVQIF
jgi:hypothetical protein